ncbi:hypothetical protein BM525_19630 (plasmid) [Alteromonas mediterranea]|uniref:Uncharacterized protein n=1 Tax=Alteromonas mediterranea TaxID=314275 RepID=A0AAC9JE75_9ALTE|nr:hypothetical protein [Alteromonas mediterranea]APD92095.1 hypothetical protein BM524_19435 [Alteromonas mediterranea]APD99949.1 hypothetical protein BM525_19630 [Alteromonas mediterranea]
MKAVLKSFLVAGMMLASVSSQAYDEGITKLLPKTGQAVYWPSDVFPHGFESGFLLLDCLDERKCKNFSGIGKNAARLIAIEEEGRFIRIAKLIESKDRGYYWSYRMEPTTEVIMYAAPHTYIVHKRGWDCEKNGKGGALHCSDIAFPSVKTKSVDSH